MIDHHNVVRGALTAGGAGNVTFAATGIKARPLSVLPVGWKGGIHFSDPNGVDWELSKCTALGSNVFSRDELLHSSTGAFISLGVGAVGEHVATAQQLNAFVSRATLTGVYAVGQTLAATYPDGVVGTIQYTRTLIAAPNTKSLISGAVANGVNSLAYTVTSADQGYAIGIDCSNQVSSAGGGQVPAAQATVKTSGVSRLCGTQTQIDEPNFATNAMYSAVYKIQAPGAAIGCRISVHNKSSMMAPAYVKASIAPTDIAARDTAANAYNAQVAGVVNNATYDATTKPNGFRKATWGGQTQSRRLYPTDAVLPSFGYQNQLDTVTSDFIPLPGWNGVGSAIAATDRTSKPETHFIVRVAVGMVVGQDGVSTWNYSKMQLMTADYVNSNGVDTTLLYGNTLGTGVDAVDGNYAIPANGNGYPPVISIEWFYPSTITPYTSLLVGDSITESYDWLRWAWTRKSTAARPIHTVNIGGSTTRTESFLGNMYLYLQSQAKPDSVTMPMISVNNYSPLSSFSLANAQFEYARLQEVAQYLTGLGIKIIWWVPFNFGANPASTDTTSAWGYLYNNAKAYAAANGIGWADINGDSRLVRSVYNASSNPTGWIAADNTHPSDPPGKAGFATVFGEFLTTIGF